MAVIINELEVVLEAPGTKQQGPQQAQASSPAQAAQQQPIRPLDIEDILLRDARAQYRLLAH